jgi:hypothetical protein
VDEKKPVDDREPSEHEKVEAAAGGQGRNGYEDELARYEIELAEYLQQRIKPGLSSSAIPLMARSIAREITHREPPSEAYEGADSDDGQDSESDGPAEFEAEMQEWQAELGDDWILRFSVHGDDRWLTAEREDGSQRLEAPNAQVLVDAVQVLDDAAGRSG